MGRLFVGILVVVAVIPAIGLARLWLSAARSRTVDLGALSLYSPTAEGVRTAMAAVRRRSRSSGLGALVGVAGAVALMVTVGGATVFFWVPLVLLGGLLGVLVGTTLPRRVWWERGPGRRPVSLGALAPAMRVAVLLAVAVAGVGLYAGPPTRVLTPDCTTGGTPFPPPALCVGLGVVAVVAWVIAEVSLRQVGRPRLVPVDGADVAVDDALRGALAHTAVGAATVVSCGSLSVTGVGLGVFAASGSCSGGGAVGTVLLTAGLAAAIAGVLVAAFLVQWGSQLRRINDTVRRSLSDSSGLLGR